ncbi:MAG: TrkH family potassium uptake protein [Phycisphaerales bacterium JB039]
MKNNQRGRRDWIGSAARRGREALGATLRIGRRSWARWTRAWDRLRAPQQLIVAFGINALVGTAVLCLPAAKEAPTAALDSLFNAVSAISTTGLTTTTVSGSYTMLGEFVLLALFQIGGIGVMTLSSLFILARGGELSAGRMGILKSQFALPHYFVMRHFVVQVIAYTVICELLGAGLLWWRFAALGVDQPLWSAVFHSVSAFATAGFSLNSDSMESFAGDSVVNLVIGVLSYLGAIGFIVAQDVWYSLKLRERMLTFTSRVILSMTGGIFVLGTAMLFLFEPAIADLPPGQRLLTSAFQIMTASSTAGFNTIPMASLSSAGLVVIMIAMLIGASPSGTGGGIKTTSVSALLGNLLSVLLGRDRVVLLGHEVPTVRVLYATAATTLYLAGLTVGVVVLCFTERQGFLPVVFEAASAIGTVGLSMGITGELTAPGKLVIITLMLAGRCGPLTIGLALLRPMPAPGGLRRDDLAV